MIISTYVRSYSYVAFGNGKGINYTQETLFDKLSLLEMVKRH